MTSFLSPQSSRRFYDFIGKMEDSQAFYEDPALDILVREGNFATAASVFEFGCGTGRLAERLLHQALPDTATYTACDISPKMVELTRKRLQRFGPRVSVSESQKDTQFSFGQAQFDRVVTSYVLDLLSPDDIQAFFKSALKALKPGGRLCIASVAPGQTFPSSAVMGAWQAIYRLSPILTGGCRPIILDPMLGGHDWSILHSGTIVAWGVTSKVLVASPR